MALRIAVVSVTAFQQNCTLVIDSESGDAAVVDPGGDVDRIIDGLAANSANAVAIWLTHGHLDHAGGAHDLADHLNSRPDRDAVDIIGPDIRDDVLLRSMAQQASLFGVDAVRNVTPTRFLTEGEQLTVGPHVFDVVHCPGHTPGHVVFINKAARFAQVGDVLFRGSVGRTDFPYGDHAVLIDSIKTKLLPLGDDMQFVCGHGPTSTIGRERLGNPFLR